jgi:hypothetical protein
MCSACGGSYEDPEELEDDLIDEENMKLYQKLVADDLRVEADLIKQGELAAKMDMLLEECWYNLNGYQYVDAQARKVGK